MKKNIDIFLSKNGDNYLVPFIIITTLFFLWGFAHSILDVLNKHFQDIFDISKAQSGMIQTVVYGGYFLMAIPAGMIISKLGYRVGVIIGLILYGIGALSFIVADSVNSFYFFLLCLFIIGCGLTCLETAANPYVTVLGDQKYSERRINISQSFNGLGWILGPFVGGLFAFSNKEASISTPYLIIGIVVLLVALLFTKIKLPEINDDTKEEDTKDNSIMRNRLFLFGVFALFTYVAAQTGINSFFINYLIEINVGISSGDAALMLSFGGMGLFMVGRLLGSYIMKYILPERVLSIFSIGCIISMVLVILNLGYISFISLFICYFFESIMFPTIFSLSLKQLKGNKKIGSSILIMSIVGGAISPLIMGFIADYNSMAFAFIIPLMCFIIIYLYSFIQIKQNSKC